MQGDKRFSRHRRGLLFPHLHLLVSYDHLTKCGNSAHASLLLYNVLGWYIINHKMKDLKFILVTIIICLFVFASNAERNIVLYKRTAIVGQSGKRTVNDDAHYITFNRNGCYPSDKNGNAICDEFFRYVKDSNGMHCYAGESNNGFSECYFSEKYDRINIKKNNETHVYIRERGNTTTASWRNTEYSGNQSRNDYIPVISPASGTTPSQTNRPTTKICRYCNGTGQTKGRIVYAPDYTGNAVRVWCDICGSSMYPHSHIDTMCKVCHGKGYIE